MNPLEGFTDGHARVGEILPRMVRRSREVLESLPPLTVLSSFALAVRLGVGTQAFRQFATHPILAGHRAQSPIGLRWGSAATIAELRRRLEGRSVGATGATPCQKPKPQRSGRKASPTSSTKKRSG